MAEVEVCEVYSLLELRSALDAHDDERDLCVVGCTASLNTVIRNLREEGEDCYFYYTRVRNVAEAEDCLAAAGWQASLGQPFFGPGYIYAIVVPEGMEEVEEYYDEQECYAESEGAYGYCASSTGSRYRRPVHIGTIYIGDGKNRNAQALETLAAGVKVVGAVGAAAAPLCGCSIM